MDGLTFLRSYMESAPVPTVVISSLTRTSGETAMRAMEAGAVDIISKPSLGAGQGLPAIMRDVCARVWAAARAARAARRRGARPRRDRCLGGLDPRARRLHRRGAGPEPHPALLPGPVARPPRRPAHARGLHRGLRAPPRCALPDAGARSGRRRSRAAGPRADRARRAAPHGDRAGGRGLPGSARGGGTGLLLAPLGRPDVPVAGRGRRSARLGRAP